ncbi:ImmA/IrrE family metallo-endopeptidase [Quadrisphaera sp. KR29]|uniref:ImmA/IrrE family metallo-endopeptidase n=1 Tax=Quadrisphaera sp. KR29 TaxID=3461391 RepID=UPI004044BD47
MSKMTAGTRDTALASGRVSMLIGEWIEARYNLPRCDVPTLGKFAPQQAADVLRQRWDLGFGPIKNMLHLMEAKGVRVFSLPMECQTVDAYSLYWKSTPVVVLTPGKTAERRRFDLAHELGHLVLHAELESFQGQQAENEANAFAAAFLMPREGLLARPLRSATFDVLLREKARWQVSAMALAHRLHELKFFSDWEYRSACIELSRQGYRRSEPGGIPHETSLMLGKVLLALRRKKIYPGAIADEIGISREDFSAHLLGLTVLNVPSGTEVPPSNVPSSGRSAPALRLA